MNGNNEARALTMANWIQICSIAGAIMWAFWVLINSQIESRIKPLEERVSELSQLQSAHEELNTQVAADNAERKAKEVEIETQFNADNQLRNVQFSDQQRLNAIMWNHITVLGQYPQAPYFQPNISQQAK